MAAPRLVCCSVAIAFFGCAVAPEPPRRPTAVIKSYPRPSPDGTEVAVVDPEGTGRPPVAGTVEIAAGVHLVHGAFVQGRQPDGNSVVLEGTEGLVVIDTGRHREHTKRVLELAAAVGGPIAAVINTHWHLDHVGGNLMIREEEPDVRVLASGAIGEARQSFLADYTRQLEGAIAAPTTSPEARERYRTERALIEQGERLMPDEVITASGRRSVAGRPLEIRLVGPAVTRGDLWILDEGSSTLIAGDLVTLPVPFLDTACPAGWREALDRLAEVRFERLVPGHGEPMGRDGFETYRRAFGQLLDCAASDSTAEVCIDSWFRDAAALVPDLPFSRSLLAYYLDNHLRGERSSCA